MNMNDLFNHGDTENTEFSAFLYVLRVSVVNPHIC